MTQISDHLKIRSAFQLIKGISRVLQKLLKYFSRVVISTSLVLPSVGALPVIFTLKLNDSEFVIGLLETSF